MNLKITVKILPILFSLLCLVRSLFGLLPHRLRRLHVMGQKRSHRVARSHGRQCLKHLSSRPRLARHATYWYRSFPRPPTSIFKALVCPAALIVGAPLASILNFSFPIPETWMLPAPVAEIPSRLGTEILKVMGSETE